MKTVQDLIVRLQQLDPSKEIAVVAPNGFMFPPEIKIEQVDKFKVLDYSRENILRYIITY